MEKQYKYAALINSQISEMFQADSENHIDPKELAEEDNATAFIHALANIAPCFFYNKLTGEDKNILEFNHAANHLVVQFMLEENKIKK